MKPTKMRNKLIYRASHVVKSKQISSPLSKDLQKKYGKKSVRAKEGDSIKIVRGEFKGVDGKISKVSTKNNSLAIDGVKKEKTKGEKFDVYVHSSNVIVTSLNTDDKWRMSKLEGKDFVKPVEKSTQEKEEKDSTKEPQVEKPKEKISSKKTKVEKTKEKEVKE